MKITLFLALMMTNALANAESKIAPLDMELGYWEVRSEVLESDMIRQALASVPAEQRDQMLAMMESQMKLPVVKECITEESLKNMDKKIRDSMKDLDDCKFTVMTSSSTELKGEVACPGNVTTMHTKVISSKRHETDVVSTIDETGISKMRSVSEWKSATCPAGVRVR